MAHVLHRCSFSPFSSESKELQPFEHCVLLRQAFNAVGPRGHKLSVFHEKEVTFFKSSEDFDALSVVRKAAEKVVESFKGDFSKLPTLSKQKVKSKVSVQASGPLANYLDAPLLDISRMHKEDNIQAIVSTPRPSLVLEEKDSRDQLRRAVEFHEMFSQAAKIYLLLTKGCLHSRSGKHHHHHPKELRFLFLPLQCCLREGGDTLLGDGCKEEDGGKIGRYGQLP